MISLNDKVAVITGGSQGLGEGIAKALASAGATTIISHLNSESDRQKAVMVVSDIQSAGGQAITLPMDVTDQDSVQQFTQACLQQYPVIDILVNNAGVFQNHLGAEATLLDFDLCYNVNVKGVWTVTRALVSSLAKKNGGKIINIASVAGRTGNESNAYCASKAAVISLTQSLARELGPDNINVNAICPGLIWTEAWEKAEGLISRTDDQGAINQRKAFSATIELMPLKRPQTIEDVGNAVTFFASSLAANVTGQALNVDGGLFMN